jgi:hypothetical protein
VSPLPPLLDGLAVRIAHLLGPGFAVLLFFAIGYRLLPRFLATEPTRQIAWLVHPAGAVAPLLLAVGYPAGITFRIGAVLESVAVVAFAVSVAQLVSRTDRERVGFYGPLLGTVLGCLGVALGLYFAFEGIEAGLSAIHLRLNIFGLLGVSIVGIVYQFYPPAVAQWPGANDRTALASIAALAIGVGITAIGSIVPVLVSPLGELLATAGATLYCYVLTATIISQT